MSARPAIESVSGDQDHRPVDSEKNHISDYKMYGIGKGSAALLENRLTSLLVSFKKEILCCKFDFEHPDSIESNERVDGWSVKMGHRICLYVFVLCVQYVITSTFGWRQCRRTLPFDGIIQSCRQSFTPVRSRLCWFDRPAADHQARPKWRSGHAFAA